MKFEKNPYGLNYILDAGDWHISYSPNPNRGSPLLMSDNGGAETAIRTPEGEWAVLNGDFRKQFERLFPDLNACMQFYFENINHRSIWDTITNTNVIDWPEKRISNIEGQSQCQISE